MDPKYGFPHIAIMNTYDWSQFHVHMYYDAPIKELFCRFSTAAGLESFFIKNAEHTAQSGKPRDRTEVVQPGDRYEWTYVHDFAHGGTFTEVIQNERIEFTFGSMTVSVSFREVDKMTEVALHQTNCATEDPERAWQHVNCRSCWIYFLTNLRSVLANGLDLRDHIHPQLNDSVSIGWDAPDTSD